ncbi:MAG: NADH-quinone oxidoreductase subunit L [Dehalococcoidia bacterium]
MTEGYLWLILLLPIASFVLIVLGLLAAPLRREQRWAGYLTSLVMLAAFGLSLAALRSAMDNHGVALGYASHNWINFGFFDRGTAYHLTIPFGVHLDGLTAVMLVVVTSVAALVAIYSQGYMHGDGGYGRYYAYISLFTASMLGLVLASSILMIFFFWELVGLCSYLLIGFWFHKPTAAAAAKKAFIVTRFGDLGFLAAIILIWSRTGTFVIAELQQMALAHQIGAITVTMFALGVFAGAAGKSAQFPLHIWLPDAMEGPTPVSALIHAATMVAAGVYLVARLYPVFSTSSEALHTVAIIGGVTALVGGLLGLVMTDIKRVLAYSTISQLGYMMLGLGTGGYVAGLFHLMNHAFFKALLFLGSGSVHHASNTFDMRKMGGMRRFMPITFWTFVIGSLSLSGIPPFSGFWSKDEILTSAWNDNFWLFLLGFVTVFLTAFYMFRAIYLTFFGEYRGGDAAELEGGGPAYGTQQRHEELERAERPVVTFSSRVPESQWLTKHLHESPMVMVLPLLILAVPAILSGFLNINGGFGDLIKGALPEQMRAINPEETNWGVLISSTVLGLLGILAATVVYYGRRSLSLQIGRAFKPAWIFLSQRMYLDDLEEGLVVRYAMFRGLCRALEAFDTYVVDGIVNGAAWFTRRTGYYAREAQNGELQTYGFVFLSGVVLIAALVFVLHP